MTAQEHQLGATSRGYASKAGDPPHEPEDVLLSIGGVLASIGATSCCVIPFALVSLGAGGAWLTYLTPLAPYQPYFLTAAFILLAAGFWRIYLRPKAVCADESYCAKPAADRFAKIGLWTGVVLLVAAVAFNMVLPWTVNW